MIIIKRIGEYDRMFEELVQEDSELLDTVMDRVKIFRNNPQDSRLKKIINFIGA